MSEHQFQDFGEFFYLGGLYCQLRLMLQYDQLLFDLTFFDNFWSHFQRYAFNIVNITWL